ncbi:hypothetical protein P154DRAFT_579174 [Amniculicola lignicola CBS 123094]|uniref:EF-hand domain-containing protein n=1 Tax=Amniculicola lignicola CBS 123094 TaxID=1392246 RepID=A0A6A5W605_9PLEO|nr:hypothetical protein P154DRAFT_579174 [Amniculicola lignicola CBS 123094]
MCLANCPPPSPDPRDWLTSDQQCYIDCYHQCGEPAAEDAVKIEKVNNGELPKESLDEYYVQANNEQEEKDEQIVELLGESTEAVGNTESLDVLPLADEVDELGEAGEVNDMEDEIIEEESLPELDPSLTGDIPVTTPPSQPHNGTLPVPLPAIAPLASPPLGSSLEQINALSPRSLFQRVSVEDRFREVDRDGLGYLTYEQILEKQGWKDDEGVRQHFAKYDANMDGVITVDELYAGRWV